MQPDERIQQTWLEMFKGIGVASEPLVRRLGDGYYAAVLRPASGSSGSYPVAVSDFERLKPYIPHLERTRAVNLHGPTGSLAPESESLASWAGGFAAEVECGKIHAVAVVDTEEFKYRFLAAMAVCGWQVEASDPCLRIDNGEFVEQVNLLNALVRMVHSRSTIETAAGVVVEETKTQFARNAELFFQFRQRFQQYRPAVFDHYFVAEMEKSCVSAGWDYWEISEKPLAESELVFQQAMDEMETVLACPANEWLPNLVADGCSLNEN
jgi:hypothetical protein